MTEQRVIRSISAADFARISDEFAKTLHPKDAMIFEIHALRAERDALRLDAARLDWMAKNPPFDAFGIDDVGADNGCVGMDIYEHAWKVADENGREEAIASDYCEGFRRMIDAARTADAEQP